MDWRLDTAVDEARDDALTGRLVDYNTTHSAAVAERFQPAHLKSVPVVAWAVSPDGSLLGGCVGRIEAVWHWLTIDTMWVDEGVRARGLGRSLLTSVEEQARTQGCRWSKLNTFDFQSPGFYRRCGYVEYGREENYPPGHANHLFRKDL